MDGAASQEGTLMATVQVRHVAEFEEAGLVNALMEAAFEAEGFPVTMEETFAYSGIWTVEVILFDTEPEAALAAVAEVLEGLKLTGERTAEVLDDATNWIALSEEIRKPVAAGRFFVHGSHDRDRRPVNTVNIEIDAEMAFGTGHHATTWACLAALDRLLLRRRFGHVLDLGTGTGVLAIAAARVLNRRVLATDIDPVAVAIARRNAAVNGVADRLIAIVADGLRHGRIAAGAPYDLILANILARPLTQLAAPIGRVLAPGGVVVLSGLRTVDEAMVLSAYRMQGLTLKERIGRDDWLALVLGH
jgi:ribosomal protein L11 methyltransferase